LRAQAGKNRGGAGLEAGEAFDSSSIELMLVAPGALFPFTMPANCAPGSTSNWLVKPDANTTGPVMVPALVMVPAPPAM